jgi:hypothetical protein
MGGETPEPVGKRSLRKVRVDMASKRVTDERLIDLLAAGPSREACEKIDRIEASCARAASRLGSILLR